MTGNARPCGLEVTEYTAAILLKTGQGNNVAESRLERYTRVTREILAETVRVSWILFRITIPVVIVVKVFEELGAVRTMAKALGPVMELAGLPGSMGIVWATAMLTNLYGAVIAFVSLAPQNPLTVAQVTVLTSMMLIAHNLPVELRVAQRAGAGLAPMAAIRVGGALVFGGLLNLVYAQTGLLQHEPVLLWQPPPVEASLGSWAVGQVENLARIFVIVLALMALIRLLRRLRVIDLLERALAPVLKLLGMTRAATDITVVGMVLGLAYGGGLILRQVSSEKIPKQDVFLSLSLMGLCHSLIEDTLLMTLIGGHVSGILLGRILFALAATFCLARLCTR